jgi:hypothetical protein
MDVQTYPDPPPQFGIFELDPSNIPPEFQDNMMAFGYWVINGALTNIPPPPPLPDLADLRIAAIRTKRAEAIAIGVLFPGSIVFAPDGSQLARLADLAVSPTSFGLASIDIELGSPPVWRNIAAADLQAAYLAFIERRELCYTNERAHIEAIQALLVAQDRTGLDNYDNTTGWPA